MVGADLRNAMTPNVIMHGAALKQANLRYANLGDVD
ncbi:pentapeptide repeat-containing protein [Rhodococcus jostii]